ncbi:MAG: hypothetical protein WCI05_05300 [Myxococcales bacterium]
MTLAKEKRIGRIREVREEQRDQRIKELTDAQLEEARKQRELDEARERTELAARGREALGHEAAQPPDWHEVETWLMDQQDRERFAELARVEAAREVTMARERVAVAHKEVQRMDALLDILVTARKKEEQRRERKLEDELASRKRF